MKKFFALTLVLAFVAISCCKHHKPYKPSNPKDNPTEQQDTIPAPDPNQDPESIGVDCPFTIKTLKDSTVISFGYQHWYDGISVLTDWTLSQDGGDSWLEPEWKAGEFYEKEAEFLILKAGTKVLIKGNQGKTNQCSILFNKDCYVYGNVMSLIYWDDFATRTELTENKAFSMLFYFNAHLLNHPNLDILFPATIITEEACEYMFSCCYFLKRAPELCATNAPESCYYAMFQDCEVLEVTPSVLLAEHVGRNAYASMFMGCDSIKEGPEIKALTADNNAFLFMFFLCDILETAPTLKIEKLSNSCYSSMFDHCPKLNYVECYATDISATYCTDQWLEGVAAEGTFVCAKGMKDKWPRGISGIPDGWTIKEVE